MWSLRGARCILLVSYPTGVTVRSGLRVSTVLRWFLPATGVAGQLPPEANRMQPSRARRPHRARRMRQEGSSGAPVPTLGYGSAAIRMRRPELVRRWETTSWIRTTHCFAPCRAGLSCGLECSVPAWLGLAFGDGRELQLRLSPVLVAPMLSVPCSRLTPTV
jgi:hypothetical protein